MYLQSTLKKNEKEQLEEEMEQIKTAVEYFDKIIDLEEPNKMILQIIIDKIYISKDKTIRFKLKPDIKKLI